MQTVENTEQKLDFSVVICAYTEERWHDIVDAVASVQRQTVPARETILVIDYNPALFRRAKTELTEAIVIENTGARGLCGARNSGIARARGSVIAFLDDDAEAHPRWLEYMRETYAGDNVLGVGGAIEPNWLTTRPGWFPEEFYWVVGCTYRGLPQKAAPVRNLIGANMSFRREVFQEVNFREGVGQVGNSMLRCDDTEFCIRLGERYPQAQLLYEPRAVVHHRVPSGRANWDYFRLRCYTEGLAKSMITTLAGTKKGLASEWKYTVKTLPWGVLRNVGTAVRRRDTDSLGRAGSITVGLALTTAGYVQGRFFKAARPLEAKPAN
jgi:glucosyl-dolichyl phosphate glucuronosyltransferase